MTLCGLTAGAFCATTLLSSATQKTVNQDVIYLYSWPVEKEDYAFILVPKSENEKFLSHFSARMSHIHGIADLEVELAKLPPGSAVAWRDFKHIGLIFPPERVRKRIEKAAASHHVTLEVIPTIYD
jgi:hypothetical protein